MVRASIRAFTGIARMALIASIGAAIASAAEKPAETSPLDRYIEEAARAAQLPMVSPGSLFAVTGRYSELARDLRSFQLHDTVTIVVRDRASALARGTTSSARASSASSSIASLFGTPAPGGARLGNLLGLESDSRLQGQGETSRESALTTTLSARVSHVLPNGYLVLEGSKDIAVNSERQKIFIRGVIRPYDINAFNQVGSDRLADLEVRVDGRGVVSDAIRRPNFLYRLLLGVLPF
jgi:flagellar L-ring protein precursor FlgH